MWNDFESVVQAYPENVGANDWTVSKKMDTLWQEDAEYITIRSSLFVTLQPWSQVGDQREN